MTSTEYEPTTIPEGLADALRREIVAKLDRLRLTVNGEDPYSRGVGDALVEAALIVSSTEVSA